MEQGVAYTIGSLLGGLVLGAALGAALYGIRRIVRRRPKVSTTRRWASSLIVGFTVATIGKIGTATGELAAGRQPDYTATRLVLLALAAVFIWWVTQVRGHRAARTPAVDAP
jgi:hypothetical protein